MRGYKVEKVSADTRPLKVLDGRLPTPLPSLYGTEITEPVVLMISHREVEQGDLASVLARLRVFLASREDAWLYRVQMALVEDGCSDDPRELVDIPEVRTLLALLPQPGGRQHQAVAVLCGGQSVPGPWCG
jgi:hypothetical protein